MHIIEKEKEKIIEIGSVADVVIGSWKDWREIGGSGILEFTGNRVEEGRLGGHNQKWLRKGFGSVGGGVSNVYN